MAIIQGSDCDVMARCRSAQTPWQELATSDRAVYERVYRSLADVGQSAINALDHENFKLTQTSGFSLSSGVRGYLPKDLWIAVSRKDATLGIPQIYAIVSERGLEFGFAAAIHPSDFSSRDFRDQIKAWVPSLFASFPDPDDPTVTKISGLLDPKIWHFREKTRLDPGRSEFSSFRELMAFVKSPAGAAKGSAAACRYVLPQDLPLLDFQEMFASALALFEPLTGAFGLQSAMVETSPPSASDDKIQRGETAGKKQQIWLIAPGEGADFWDEFKANGIIAIGWDDLDRLDRFNDREAIVEAMKKAYQLNTHPTNDSLCCYEFVHEIQVGDRVIAKQGRSKILGDGIVTGPYIWDDTRPRFRNVRMVRWDRVGEWQLPSGGMPVKTLTNVSASDKVVPEIDSLLIGSSENEAVLKPSRQQVLPFDETAALSEMFLSPEEFRSAVRAWRDKKNLILQGAPGVGKTYIAKTLSYALMGSIDASRVTMIQLHQSYSYEEFVQGYRPSNEGLELKPGRFTAFCQQAKSDENPCVFVIDEINRGNLSKIFGELMLTIEADKRGSKWAVPLAYAGAADEQFFVPENVYVLGLMNTADRSLSVIDYALRRRFAFLTLKSMIGTSKFSTFLADRGVSTLVIEAINRRFSQLNDFIADKEKSGLGSGFCIGHSFFTPTENQSDFDAGWYRRTVESQILPTLEEYWFDDDKRVEYWKEILLADI